MGWRLELNGYAAAALAGAGVAYLAASFTTLRRVRQLLEEFEARRAFVELELAEARAQRDQAEDNAEQLVQDMTSQLTAKAELASRVQELQDALDAVGRTREMLELQLELSEQTRGAQAGKLQRLEQQLTAMLDTVEAAAKSLDAEVSTAAVATAAATPTSQSRPQGPEAESSECSTPEVGSRPASHPEPSAGTPSAPSGSYRPLQPWGSPASPCSAASCASPSTPTGPSPGRAALDALQRLVEAGLAEARGLLLDGSSSTAALSRTHSHSSSWDGTLEPGDSLDEEWGSMGFGDADLSGISMGGVPANAGGAEHDCQRGCSRGSSSRDLPALFGVPVGGWAAPPPSPMQPQSGHVPGAAASGKGLRGVVQPAAAQKLPPGGLVQGQQQLPGGYVSSVVTRVELQGAIAGADGSVVTPRRQLQYAVELEQRAAMTAGAAGDGIGPQ